MSNILSALVDTQPFVYLAGLPLGTRVAQRYGLVACAGISSFRYAPFHGMIDIFITVSKSGRLGNHGESDYRRP